MKFEKFTILLSVPFIVCALYQNDFSTASDLYAKKFGFGVCTRVVTTSFVLATAFNTSVGGMQCSILSNSGSTYYLYEDVSCTRPVYFII